jgi:integrase
MELPYLTPKEVKHLIDSITDTEQKTAIQLGFSLGCRVGEINKIPNTSNVSTLIDVLDSKADGKSDSNRSPYRQCLITTATLNQIKTFQNYLNDIKDNRKFLFPYDPKTFNRWIKHWCDVAGITREKKRLIRWHMVRHTYIQNAINMKVPLKQVSQQTGDSIFTLFKYYENYTPEQRQEMAEATSVI